MVNLTPYLRISMQESYTSSSGEDVHFKHYSQKDVPSGPSDSLKLEGVVDKHMVEVKLWVAIVASSAAHICSRSAALGMGRETPSKPKETSLRLERRESPSLGFAKLVFRKPAGARPVSMPMSSSPGGGRRQASDPTSACNGIEVVLLTRGPGIGAFKEGGMRVIDPVPTMLN